MKLSFSLPWPDKRLSPNARINYFTRAKLFKQEKSWARMSCHKAMVHSLISPPTGITRDNPINIRLTLVPPNLRYRDEDNLIANCKAVFDGIAEALQINDHFFHFREMVWKENEKPGELLIDLDWSEDVKQD